MNPNLNMTKIDDAAARLRKRVNVTPVMNSPILDEILGVKLLVKAECLQKTGSFKFRGALNKMLQMTDEQRRRGVVVYSAGNHGHGIAAAARLTGGSAVIIIPDNAPTTKVASCAWWGAEIVRYDHRTESREEIADRIAGERGMTIVSPFDDYDIIAGQATAGLEFGHQLVEADVRPDIAIVPCSGGGLSAGAISALRSAFPGLEAYVVEPEGLDKMALSLREGRPMAQPMKRSTIIDGLNGPMAGSRPVEILLGLGAGGLSVSDEQAAAAAVLIFSHLKLVVEPAGATGVAALISNPERFRGRTVAVIASGGNTDCLPYAAMLADARP